MRTNNTDKFSENVSIELYFGHIFVCKLWESETLTGEGYRFDGFP